MFIFSEFINESNSKLLSSLISVMKSASDPLSVSEIISRMDLSITRAKNPRNSISTRLNEYSNNSKQADKSKKPYFTIVSQDPLKFWLLDRLDELNVVKNVDKKYTFVEAAQIALKENGNKPMSVEEIWDEISNMVETKGKTPESTLRVRMSEKSINSPLNNKSKTPIFKIVSTSPQKYILLNPDSEIQADIENDEFDLDLPKSKKSFDYPENEVIPFSHFRGAQSEPESKQTQEFVKNPFIQSICILGEAGAGKSTTTIDVLEKDPNHEFDLLIPTDITSSILLDFVKGDLELSKVSEMIISSYENPNKKYTVLIDEFHKPLVLRRVNDELLQSISLRRYRGNRFISNTVAYRYISSRLKESKIDRSVYDYHGNIRLPDNFGFIFLSSKPSVVVDNDDLYDRLDIIYMRQEDRDSIETVDDLLSMKIEEKSDKLEFKDIIKSDTENLDDFIDKFNS